MSRLRYPAPEPAATKESVRTSIAGVVLAVVVIGGGLQYFQLKRDLDSLHDRAQIAANPQDMLVYLRGLRASFTRHGATSGHTALLLKTPANDLALHFQALNSVIRRLEQVEGLPPDSAAYQTALDDLRGVLREMPRVADGVFWVQYGWWMALVGFFCFGALAND